MQVGNVDNATSGATFTRTVQPSPDSNHHQTCLVQLKIARNAPRLLGFAIGLGLDDPSPGCPDSPCNFGDRIRRSLANHAEYGTRNREIEIWHVFGRACGSGPPHGVAVHDEFQDVDDGLTTRALQEADSERLVDAGQVPIEVIPAAPHGDKSNPNVALFPGFSPSGIARSSIAAASHATYDRSGM